LKKYLVFAILFVYLVLIFLLSNQSGWLSNSLSSRIVERAGEYISLPGFIHNILGTPGRNFNYLFRKLSHFMEYAVLSVLMYKVAIIFVKRVKAALAASLVMCFTAAVFDEFHQAFVPGRTSLVSDILIDLSGSAAGLLFLYICKYLVSRVKSFDNRSAKR